MKKYVTLVVGVLLVLAFAWVALGQTEGGRRGGGAGGAAGGPGGAGGGGGMRGGFGMNREAQLKAVAAIQEQLGKLKASLDASPAMPAGGFANLSEEERTKMRESFTKMGEERQLIMDALDAEMAKLRGARQLVRDQQEGTKELEAIREVAAKEQAKETVKAVDELIAKRQKALEEKMAKLGLEMPRPRTGGAGGGPGGAGGGTGGGTRGTGGGTRTPGN